MNAFAVMPRSAAARLSACHSSGSSLNDVGRPLITIVHFIALIALLIAIRVATNMLNGRTGRAWVAIRDHPIAAAAMGIDTARYKTLVFGTSTLFTGVAGALSAITIGYVSPESYSLFLSVSFLVGSAVGGISTIGGAIIGGFFIQFVPNFANDISDAAPWAIYGVAMLICMYTMPHGVVGTIKPWLARLVQWTTARSDHST
jgi:branched-chain amino acid transport system permease protein